MTRQAKARKVKTQRLSGFSFAARKRFLLVLLIVLLLVALGGLIHYLRHHPLWPVERVVVLEPEPPAHLKGVAQVVKPVLHRSLLTLSLSQMQQTMEQLPWVHEAAIRRQWPDAIMVHFREQRAKAIWSDHGLLNDQGALFQSGYHMSEADQQQLPLIKAQKAQLKTAFNHLKQFNKQLGEALSLHPTQLILSEDGVERIKLSNGLNVIFDELHFSSELLSFKIAYPKLFNHRNPHGHTVDLRYPNGLAVSRD